MVAAADLMTGINRACAYWEDAVILHAQRDGLASAYDGGRDSTIDKAKGIVETVCKTILEERGVEVGELQDFGEFVSKTLDAIDLGSDRGQAPHARITKHLNNLAKEINAFRNKHGVVAHGKYAFLDPLTVHQRTATLLAADSLISVLFDAYRGLDPSLKHTKAPYEKFEKLNGKIDEAAYLQAEVDEETGMLNLVVSIGSGDGLPLSFPVSQLLYDLDRNAYVEVLRALDPDGEQELEPEEGEAQAPIAEEAKAEEDEAKEEGPAVEPKPEPAPSNTICRVPEYEGRYADKIHPLFDVLSHEVGLDGVIDTNDINDLTKTILHGFEQVATIDWQDHPSGQARVRTFLKKVAKFYGLPADQFPIFMERMEDWLKVRLEV